jgi:hypothetical protein
MNEKMKKTFIPTTYEEWRHCINVECGIELTSEYIAGRISALKDDKDYHTQQIVKLYGQEHLDRVQNWFLQSQVKV